MMDDNLAAAGVREKPECAAAADPPLPRTAGGAYAEVMASGSGATHLPCSLISSMRR